MLYRSHQARIRPTETAILFELYPKRDGGYVACVYGFIHLYRIYGKRVNTFIGKWVLNCKSCDEINCSVILKTAIVIRKMVYEY